jgi:hypothetical protein
MTAIILFAISLLGLSLMVGLASRRPSPRGELQRESDWFRIDMVKIQDDFNHLKKIAQPYLRTFLYRAIETYRAIVTFLRKKVRKIIQKALKETK